MDPIKDSSNRYKKTLNAAFLIAAMIILSSCKEEYPEKVSPVESFSQLQELFKDPPADYRSAPLWDWNHRISEVDIRPPGSKGWPDEPHPFKEKHPDWLLLP